MHFNLQSVVACRNRRLAETIEDGYLLVSHHRPDISLKFNLENTYSIFEDATPVAKEQLLADPRIAGWFSVDLSPLIDDPKSEIANELAETVVHHISHLSIGAAHVDRKAFEIQVKPLPDKCFLPGTNFRLSWDNALNPFASVQLRSDGSVVMNGSTMKQKPAHRYGRFIIPNSDPLLAPPFLEGYSLSVLTDEELKTWEAVLQATESLLGKCQQSDELVSSFGRFLLPLERSSSGAHLSVSFKSRPGIIYLSSSDSPFEIAEALVHESDHQCLYEVINEEPLFTPNPVNSDCRFESPWRTDPRPLTGLFFGLSAFVTVGRFWSKIAQSDIEPNDFVGKRAVLALEQSLDAISVVEVNGDLTEAGTALLRFNKEQARTTLEGLQCFRDFPAWTAWSKMRRQRDSEQWNQQFCASPNIEQSRELETSE